MAEGTDLVRRLYAEAFNQRNSIVLDDLVTEDFTENAHAPFGTSQPGRVNGPEHMRRVVASLTDQFTDLIMEPLAIVEQDDLVAVRVHARGTNTGKLNGMLPPTGRTFTAEQSHWYRVAEGRLAEHWATRDDLTALVQLGIVTPPGSPRSTSDPGAES